MKSLRGESEKNIIYSVYISKHISKRLIGMPVIIYSKYNGIASETKLPLYVILNRFHP